MPNIDLHMHSVYSDGTCTPSELVTCAKQKGLFALSLTDHDTIDGLEEAQLYCRKEGIVFINGIENHPEIELVYENNKRSKYKNR